MAKKVNPNDLDRILNPDKHHLDDEWLSQAQICYHWNQKAADADRDVDVAKRRIDVTMAEVYDAVSSAPAEFGLTKVTVDAVKSAVERHPDVKNAKGAYNEAVHQRNIVRAACKAIDQRKDALEHLVKLWARDYFAAPVATGTDAEVADNIKTSSTYKRIQERRRKRKEQADG